MLDHRNTNIIFKQFSQDVYGTLSIDKTTLKYILDQF